MDLKDPVTVASVLVRDCLDTLISRHQGNLKQAGARTRAESEAVIQIANGLLQHLPGEAKQARADRA